MVMAAYFPAQIFPLTQIHPHTFRMILTAAVVFIDERFFHLHTRQPSDLPERGLERRSIIRVATLSINANHP